MASIIGGNNGGCQCPVAGLLHFYGSKPESRRRVLDVSMPCGGLTPFLQVRQPHVLKSGRCVNALWRAYSISTIQLPILLRQREVVSMPCGGLTPFLPKGPEKEETCIYLCVNALWRAYSISTPPDETTHSDWGFGHHFLTYLSENFKSVLKRGQKWA